jgi:hypothetical protein
LAPSSAWPLGLNSPDVPVNNHALWYWQHQEENSSFNTISSLGTMVLLIYSQATSTSTYPDPQRASLIKLKIAAAEGPFKIAGDVTPVAEEETSNAAQPII